MVDGDDDEAAGIQLGGWPHRPGDLSGLLATLTAALEEHHPPRRRPRPIGERGRGCRPLGWRA